MLGHVSYIYDISSLLKSTKGKCCIEFGVCGCYLRVNSFIESTQLPSNYFFLIVCKYPLEVMYRRIHMQPCLAFGFHQFFTLKHLIVTNINMDHI